MFSNRIASIRCGPTKCLQTTRASDKSTETSHKGKNKMTKHPRLHKTKEKPPTHVARTWWPGHQKRRPSKTKTGRTGQRKSRDEALVQQKKRESKNTSRSFRQLRYQQQHMLGHESRLSCGGTWSTPTETLPLSTIPSAGVHRNHRSEHSTPRKCLSCLLTRSTHSNRRLRHSRRRPHVLGPRKLANEIFHMFHRSHLSRLAWTDTPLVPPSSQPSTPPTSEYALKHHAVFLGSGIFGPIG